MAYPPEPLTIHKLKPFFSDSQVVALRRNPEYEHFGDVCPVCLGENAYKYKGETYECPQDDYGHLMLRLAKLYWLHNIPLQYQQLDWADYPNAEAKVEIESYVMHYTRMRINGMGISFMSKQMGIGKTWGATYVLKELVKQGVDGWFVPFWQIPGYKDLVDRDEAKFKIDRLQRAELVVIDDVTRPTSPAMRDYFAAKLEEFVRPRTDSHLPTIITTNMTSQDLEDEFPRIFSLLMAKNIVIEIKGKDARVDGTVYKNAVKSILAGEARPIQ